MRLSEGAIWSTESKTQAVTSPSDKPVQNWKLRKSGEIDRKLIREPASSELVAQLDQEFCAATGVQSKELAVRLVAQLQSLRSVSPTLESG